MENQDIEILLTKYREGTATTAEKALLESWYLQRDNAVIPELTPQEFAEDLLLIARDLPLQEPVRKLVWWPRVAAVAAAVTLFFMIYLVWPFIHGGPHPANLAMLTVPSGQPKQLRLADGSKIWVNAGSQLKYPKSFDGKTREVYLSGEAYFDIRHNAEKPFIIHTGKVLTTVLGTAFDIREDRLHHTVQVTVTRGKVSVADGGRLLGVITPNQQLTFNTLNLKAEQHSVDAMRVTPWQRIGLRFEDITFGEAAAKLEAKFKVRIRFADDRVKNCRFTGAALNGDQLDTVLKTICDFNNATYGKQPDGSILIDGPGCDR